MKPDVIVSIVGNDYYAEFITPAAKYWANTQLNDSAEWVEGRLRFTEDYVDHFEHAMFDADLEFAEAPVQRARKL